MAMGFQQSHIEKMLVLSIALFVVIIIDLPDKSHKFFYVPQSYSVKMYHRANMLTTGEGGTERFILNLTATGEQGQSMHESPQLGIWKIHTSRKKRTAADSGSVGQENLYDESMYQGSFESSDGTNNTDANNTYIYDYEKLKNEYYQEEIPLNKSTNNETSNEEYPEEQEQTTVINLNKVKQKNVTSANVPMENYCSVILLFRIRMLECFLYGISKPNDNIKYRSGWVIAFWIILYVTIASYLWCTRGWCCCCCPCACCHPYNVIQEAKQFLIQNPPGVAHLHSKRKVQYEPSNYEREIFKVLENEVYNF